MFMEVLDLVLGQRCQCVIHIPFPKRRWYWMGGQCSTLHILHDKVGYSNRHRGTHGCAKGLLVELYPVGQELRIQAEPEEVGHLVG